jgi:uncharacterized membrane protein
VTALLKFVHIGAIGVWSAGLIVLPYLFWQRGHLPGGGFELDRLQRLTRFIYVALTSPAAFLAIASGTALIFLQATFAEWFSLKLLLVGAMAMLHVVAGLIGTRLILTDARFGAPSFFGLTGLYLALIVAILWVVLAKPAIDGRALAPELFAPGALRHLLVDDTSTPMP